MAACLVLCQVSLELFIFTACLSFYFVIFDDQNNTKTSNDAEQRDHDKDEDLVVEIVLPDGYSVVLHFPDFILELRNCDKSMTSFLKSECGLHCLLVDYQSTQPNDAASKVVDKKVIRISMSMTTVFTRTVRTATPSVRVCMLMYWYRCRSVDTDKITTHQYLVEV